MRFRIELVMGLSGLVLLAWVGLGCEGGSLSLGDDDVVDDDDATDDDDASGCEGRLFTFESGDEGFTHAAADGGFDESWELGNPQGEGCYSDQECWVTNLQGEYGDCESGELLSPVIDLSACEGNVTLTFWHLYRFEEPEQTIWDGGLVQLSDDGGDSWESVQPAPSYDGAVEGNYSECNGSPEIDGSRAWSGTVPGNDWIQVVVPVEESFLTSGFRIRFLYGTDRGVTDEGWYIDDVEVVVE